MSVIEEAAKRLAQLQRAGINLPDRHSISEEPTSERRFSLSVPSGERPIAPEAPADSTTAKRAPEDEAHRSPAAKSIELDLPRLAANGIVTPNAARSQLADEFRVIKRPLLANARREGPAAIKNGNLIIITSALPGEGKSFTSVNLAMSMAMELDRTVLLVDADVARPSLPSILGLPQAQGLLDVLVNHAVQLADVLLKTNVEKLTILPSGTQHPRATELLASDSMNQLLEEMAHRYADRIIIFDSPPLLVTTEARVLATHMGQVVMVVHAEHTSQADVKHALSTIEACDVKLLVLNKGRASMRGGYGYGYGSGYGYGYGYGYGDGG